MQNLGSKVLIYYARTRVGDTGADSQMLFGRVASPCHVGPTWSWVPAGLASGPQLGSPTGLGPVNFFAKLNLL